MTRSTSTLLAVVALFLIPAAVTFEYVEPQVWQDRLAVFLGKDMVNRHTPLHTKGTFLPPRLTGDVRLTPSDNPVILAGRTEIPIGFTLTVEPGVTLFAHEFAELAISGTLRMQGSETQPVILTSNERHPQNQIWNGIIVQSNAQAGIHHTQIHHASPGVTCLAGSEVTVQDSEITQALIGIFTQSPTCAATNTRIEAIHEQYIRAFPASTAGPLN